MDEGGLRHGNGTNMRPDSIFTGNIPDMPCTKPFHPRGSAQQGSAVLPAGSGYGQTGPSLVVSNAPENLGKLQGSTQARVLYSCAIPMPASDKASVRVFIWHINQTKSSGTLSLRISPDAPAGSASQVVDRRWASDVASSGYQNIGPDLACQQYYNTYDNVTTDPIVLNYPDEQVLLSLDSDHGQLVAAVFEFTIASIFEYNLLLRTTFTGIGGSVPPIGTAPVPFTDPNGAVHVRGSWPYSEVTFPVSTGLDVNPDLAVLCVDCPVEESGILIVPAPELALNAFGKQPGDTYGTPDGDKGLYGAVVVYRFSLVNSNHLFAGSAALQLMGWNIGADPTYGSGKVLIVGTDGQIPPINWLNPDVVAPPGAVGVPPDGSGELKFSMTVGGAAALPVNLRVCSVPLT